MQRDADRHGLCAEGDHGDDGDPGLSSHPMLSIAKGLQIKYLLKQPQAKGLGFTKENVDAIIDACNKLEN